MTRPAALYVVVGLSVIAVGWPIPSYGQPADTGAGGAAASRAGAPQTQPAHHPDQSGRQQPPSTAADQTTDDHAGHGANRPPAEDPGIPPITDADRAAAFPDVDVSAVHDNDVNSFVLFDQLEWQGGEAGVGVSWDSKGWIGRDRDRLWFRAEGQAEDGHIGDAEAHLFYGRAFARWWDVVVGLRQDLRPEVRRQEGAGSWPA